MCTLIYATTQAVFSLLKIHTDLTVLVHGCRNLSMICKRGYWLVHFHGQTSPREAACRRIARWSVDQEPTTDSGTVTSFTKQEGLTKLSLVALSFNKLLFFRQWIYIDIGFAVYQGRAGWRSGVSCVLSVYRVLGSMPSSTITNTKSSPKGYMLKVWSPGVEWCGWVAMGGAMGKWSLLVFSYLAFQLVVQSWLHQVLPVWCIAIILSNLILVGNIQNQS